MIEDKLLELPEIISESKVPKITEITEPNVNMLTEEQTNIFRQITNLNLNSFSQSLITGYSGTGKSFLVSKIIQELLYKNKSLNIAITAPTNKAVMVLKNLSIISETHKRVEFVTLHSLLGLKRKITNDGKEIFAAIDNNCEIYKYKLVLVDEVSMLDNELYETLRFQAEMNRITLLFIGDRGQIPPVNGGESILFKSKLDNNYNLTKIIRQSEGNPIIELAQTIRLNKPFKKQNIIDENNNGISFYKINTEQVLLEKFFNSEHFKNNANFVKVLAWTNSAVNYYNTKVRAIIYGENCDRLCKGEKMVCNKPITNSKKQIIMNNNDEFEVLEFVVKQENRGYSYYYYEIKVISNGNIFKIKMLHEQSEDEFNKDVAKLKSIAEKSKGFDKRKNWVKYYNLLERYADVKYNYALTVHKSQGSTFDNAIVINCDIDRIYNSVERNKLLYTAITRAKNKLFMI